MVLVAGNGTVSKFPVSSFAKKQLHLQARLWPGLCPSVPGQISLLRRETLLFPVRSFVLEGVKWKEND